MKRRICLAVWCLIIWAAMSCAPGAWAETQAVIAAQGGMDLYLVRHAETVANATHDYTGDNERRFTEKGQAQLEAMTRKLQAYRFDEILVSPKLRTRQSILPYLKATGRQAAIWPEIGECCWQKDRQAPASPAGTRGDAIVISEEDALFFRLRDAESNTEEPAATYADGVIQMDKAIRLLKERYGGSGKSILLVGHFMAGSAIVNLLLERDPATHIIAIQNGKITHLRQNPDGSFSLLLLNDVPRSPRK